MFFNDTFQVYEDKSIEYLDREIPFHEIDSSGNFADIFIRLKKVTGDFSSWHKDRNRSFDINEYYELGKFMEKAYSGQYKYEEKPVHFNEFMVRRLIDEDRYLSLCVPKVLGFPLMWHTFDQCSSDTLSKKEWITNCELVPLNPRDMLHIEWNIREPFQAPFLYPLVGGKNPLMHYPIDALDLVIPHFSNPWLWKRFRDDKWDSKFFSPVTANDYRLGKLIEFLCVRKNRNPETVKDLWKKIEEYYKSIPGWQNLRKNLKKKNQ